uniref:Uncharacterized protein n=1 Tax=Zonotrichia albicollis TaxID=44394 RepID=A0A8D2QEI7_ZONAL
MTSMLKGCQRTSPLGFPSGAPPGLEFRASKGSSVPVAKSNLLFRKNMFREKCGMFIDSLLLRFLSYEHAVR